MQKFISKYQEFQGNLSTLEDYILFNKDTREANYREYRDIVYGAIINRGYALWETFVKDIFYIYFSLKKQDFYENNTIVERYKLHELPSFLFESAVLNIDEERISFDLNKDILSYTSKNMDMKELSRLFKRVDLDIQNKLNNNSELKDAVYSFELAFENGLLKENKTSQALKRLIQERNLVSHYAHLDTFQSIDILLEWIKYYKILGKNLSKEVCLEFVKTLDQNKKMIGDCKIVHQRSILLVDIYSEIEIDKNTKLFVYSNNTLIDIVIPKSFRIEDNEVTSVSEHDKAGIKVQTIFEYETNIKKEHKYYVIEGI
ncbi:HEPN domain-containing protein [Gracilibacillus massiliensis]|uniref:HEPN domain-containing protein n=1 Tax=Gracilibacillus massiliensis TaxID=1564956 RepID=UPI00071DE4B3|nr:HEPN domain-containing protein [Gracilibacillus massiliensis]